MSHLTPEALEAAAIDPSGADAHLAACAACRQSVRDARGRRALLAGLTPYTLSDVGFRRVGAKLAEAADEGLAPPLRWPWVAAGLALAAAAVLVLAVQVDVADSAAQPPVTVAEAAPFQPLTVVQSSGDAQRKSATGWGPLQAGDVVREATAISAT
ncbi:MAG: hypothetical protein JNG84_11955, partial [Archangium sp.]|nr:hypothetical protein [Archangium sp.]